MVWQLTRTHSGKAQSQAQVSESGRRLCHCLYFRHFWAQGLVPSQCLLVETGSTVLKCLEEKLHLNLVLKEKEKMVIWGRNSVYPHFLSLSLLL